MRGYEAIKELAARWRRPIPELLALARKNDPFFSGTPTQVEQAEWFQRIILRRSAGRGGEQEATYHLRRIHYWAVSQATPLTLPNGKLYENTEECWNYLCDAGKAARYLGLVDADSFVDRRNPEPHLFIHPRTAPRPEISLEVYDAPELPEIRTDYSWDLELDPPGAYAWGYEYDAADQPYHLEAWIEKSTQNDVLEPVCAELGINLVTSLGFQSITGVVALLQRVEASGKPARVFYISDFDPAGDGMPLAVARQLEFWQPQFAPGAEVKLQSLALTREQVQHYRLPRIPIKESDLRRGRFEGVHGEGAVELDALQELYPGSLAQLLREAAAPFRDEELDARLRNASHEATRKVWEGWRERTAAEREQLAEIAAAAAAVTESYRERLEALSAEMAEDMAPLQERVAEVWEEVAQRAAEFRESFPAELPERPEPDTAAGEQGDAATDWLLDTNRDYLEQLERYQQHKEGG